MLLFDNVLNVNVNTIIDFTQLNLPFDQRLVQNIPSENNVVRMA